MSFFKKIKAGALQYVLIISVIIAIVLFAFISLLFLQQKLQSKFNFSKEAIANSQMAFDFIENSPILKYNEAQVLEFSENELASVTAKKSIWGIFDLVTITSTVKNEVFKKIALMGGSKSTREALYLQDNNQQLVVVGNTRIQGDVFLPKRGVRAGAISGTSYYGSKYIYGNLNFSDNKLPQIKNLKQLQNFKNSIYENEYDTFELEQNLKKHQSFKEKPLVFTNDNAINLNEVSLKGNLIIVSKTKINVLPSAILENVILIAPEINIESKVKGNFQAIATKIITVDSKVNLKYPSALIVLDEENNSAFNHQKNEKNNGIFIGENSDIKGIVVYHTKNSAPNYNTQLEIKSKTNITGEVYCSENIALEGNIVGSLYTKIVLVNASGRRYINHLYNVILDAKSLPKQYAGLMVNSNKYKVAKWLD